MDFARLTQGDIEAFAGLAVHAPMVGANVHVYALRACARLLAIGMPVNLDGVWQ